MPLTDEGKQEALEAGKLLAAAGFRFDVAHASVLKRACTSLHRLLDGSGQPYVPIKTSWRLNERWVRRANFRRRWVVDFVLRFAVGGGG